MTAADASPCAYAIRHDGWGELVLSRPQRRNAIVGPMVADLRRALADLLAQGARAVVLRGEGGAFCSGLDVDAFAQSPPPSWRATFTDDWAAWHHDLYRCPAVIVGALERHAINGGASMALACDLLVAGEGAYLTVGEAAQGMHAPMNVAWLRIKTTEAIAVQLTLGAQRVKAADLMRLGLCFEVVPDDQVATKACELGAKLASYPGQGLAAIKASLRRPIEGGGEAIFDGVRAGQRAASAPPQRIGGTT
jgi:enoyl-CoA hydratase/carnithine racemase